MFIVQIEHEVLNFDSWLKAFESDPIDRKKAGVRRYSIFRENDHRNLVIIELEFDNLTEAENICLRLKKMWERIDGTMLVNPKLRILVRIGQEEILQ
jgi:hypothetical protein